MAWPCRAARWLTTREEAEAAAKSLFDAGATGVVVKAQIHAGGRGKGGGVKIAKSVEEAGELAEQDAGHDADHASDRARRHAWCAAC